MSKKNDTGMLFDKSNYMLLGGGVAAILIGFILMSGGGAESLDEFHYDEIFSFRRITLTPLVVIIGFAIVGWGILKKPAATDSNLPEEGKNKLPKA